MIGQRRPRTWRFDMLPAPGETSWPAAVVERERRVAGDVFERNGHMDLDWRKRASMLVNGVFGVRARRCGAQLYATVEGGERWWRVERRFATVSENRDRNQFICHKRQTPR
jgi:hypothetical protein